jgi:hypothetical protein
MTTPSSMRCSDSRFVTITRLTETPLAGREVKFYTLFEA